MTNTYTMDENGNLKPFVSYINKDDEDRLLDMKIAEKYFSWYDFEYDDQFDDWAGFSKAEDNDDYWLVPSFTTDISETLKLIEILHNNNLILDMKTFKDYNYVEIKQNDLDGEDWTAESDTLMKAICLAAEKVDNWSVKNK